MNQCCRAMQDAVHEFNGIDGGLDLQVVKFCPFCGLARQLPAHYWGDADQYSRPNTAEDVLMRMRIYVTKRIDEVEARARRFKIAGEVSGAAALLERVHDLNGVLFVLTNEETVFKLALMAGEEADKARSPA